MRRKKKKKKKKKFGKPIGDPDGTGCPNYTQTTTATRHTIATTLIEVVAIVKMLKMR